MQRWMEFIQSRNPDFLRKKGVGPNFADWLAPDEHTNKDLLATAYWALIANMMSQMAHAVGKDADAKRYDDLVQSIRAAFQKAYIKDDGDGWNGNADFLRGRALHQDGARRHLNPFWSTNSSKTSKLVTGIFRPDSWARPSCCSRLPITGAVDVAYRLLAERHLSVLGIHALEGRDHLVGALEWGYRRSFHEFLQPLCLRLGHRLGVSLCGRNRYHARFAGIQGNHDSSASRFADDLLRVPNMTRSTARSSVNGRELRRVRFV